MAVRRALDLLARASENWRGNGAADVGSLHWPIAISVARRELTWALEVLEPQSEANIVRARKAHHAEFPL